MHGEEQQVVDISQVQGCEWTDIEPRVRFYVGGLNGLAGFFVATTFGWSHRAWFAGLLIPCIACLLAGIVMTSLLKRAGWQRALVTSIAVGLVFLIFGAVIMHIPLGLTIITAFCLFIASGLALPYTLQVDVGDACVINLRLFTAISVVGIVIYVLNNAFATDVRNPLTIGYTLVMAIGLIAAELLFARHVQSISTRLSQKSLRYAGAGVLTLAALAAGLGPFALVLGAFVAAVILSAVLIPILFPLISFLVGRFHRLHGTLSQTAPLPPSQPHPTTLNAGFHATHETWFIWSAFLVVLFGFGIWLLLRNRKKNSELEKNGDVQVAPVSIQRDSQIDVFRLEQTLQPIRKAYQRRLLQLHHQGLTIGKAESPRELLRRLPGSERTETDDSLTQAYERVRYGEEADPDDL